MAKDERPPITESQRRVADEAIGALVANPPTKREVSTGEKWLETAQLASPEAKRALDRMREKLARDRGMTLAQWLELESQVSHPREFIAVTPSHRTIARRRMTAAGVPPLFIESVADREPIDCEPLQNVKAFLNSRDVFRVLSGGKGVRKTGSACWALGQLDGGMFVHVRELTRMSIEQREKFDAMCKAPLVVLDDLGTEKRDEKGAFQAAASELIDRIYGSRGRLLVTANITPQTFRQVYGEREYDRLKEFGQWSTIAGQSVRSYTEREPGCDDE